MHKTWLIVTLIVLGLFAGERTYEWKKHTDKRSFYADASGSYLFGPSGVVGPDGKDLTRQELLDAFLHELVEKGNYPGLHFKK